MAASFAGASLSRAAGAAQLEALLGGDPVAGEALPAADAGEGLDQDLLPDWTQTTCELATEYARLQLDLSGLFNAASGQPVSVVVAPVSQQGEVLTVAMPATSVPWPKAAYVWRPKKFIRRWDCKLFPGPP